MCGGGVMIMVLRALVGCVQARPAGPSSDPELSSELPVNFSHKVVLCCVNCMRDRGRVCHRQAVAESILILFWFVLLLLGVRTAASQTKEREFSLLARWDLRT